MHIQWKSHWDMLGHMHKLKWFTEYLSFLIWNVDNIMPKHTETIHNFQVMSKHVKQVIHIMCFFFNHVLSNKKKKLWIIELKIE